MHEPIIKSKKRRRSKQQAASSKQQSSKQDSMENPKESHMQSMKGKRVVLFPLPLQGHVNPMLQLANILHTKGFSITIIHTEFNSPNAAKHPHFTFCSFPDGLLEHQASTVDVLALLALLNVNCAVPFRDCLAKLLANVEEEEPVTCLITDAVWHFSQAVADSLKLPRIVLRTSSVCSLLPFSVIPLLRNKGYLPIQDSKFEVPIPEVPPLKVKDIPMIETCGPQNLDQLVSVLDSQIKTSAGLIWNNFEELDQISLFKSRKFFPVPTFPIGPFHKYFPASSSSLLSEDSSLISWLDKQAPKSVIYVSFGSIATVNEAEFLEIAWGLANSNQPFLWVVRPGSVCGAKWLEPLPNGFLEMLGGKGLIVKWAPQQQVLAHSATGGFWTHNGWNSTMESICEGVPMICQPCFGDQRVNARYVSDIWRVGVHLEYKLERKEIEKAIRKVLVEAEGQEIRERIMDLKEKANHCLKPGGSSYQSLERLINHILSF